MKRSPTQGIANTLINNLLHPFSWLLGQDQDIPPTTNSHIDSLEVYKQAKKRALSINHEVSSPKRQRKMTNEEIAMKIEQQASNKENANAASAYNFNPLSWIFNTTTQAPQEPVANSSAYSAFPFSWIFGATEDSKTKNRKRPVSDATEEPVFKRPRIMAKKTKRKFPAVHKYDIVGNEVSLNGKKIGIIEKGLLVLSKEESNLEWVAIKAFQLEHNITNGKISRKHGFHHTYEIVDGKTYRLDHSMIAKTPNSTYSQRGYLGEGSFANVKKATSEDGNQAAVKIEAMTQDEYTDYLKKPKLNKEQKQAAKLGELIGANVIKSNTKALWRANQSQPPVAKRHTLLKLASGEELYNILNDHLNDTTALSTEQRYLVAYLVAKAYERRFKSGHLHRDHKHENVRVDLKKMLAKDVDFGFTTSLPSDDFIGEPEVTDKHAMGTPGFIAPEILFQVAGKSIYSQASEVFAFGEMLYDLATLKSTAEQKDAASFDSEMSPLKALARRMLQLKDVSGKEINGNDLFELFKKYEHLLYPAWKKTVIEARHLRPTFAEVTAELRAEIEKRLQTKIQDLMQASDTLIGDEKSQKLAEIADLYDGWDYQRKGKCYLMASNCAINSKLKEKYQRRTMKAQLRATQEVLLDTQHTVSSDLLSNATEATNMLSLVKQLGLPQLSNTNKALVQKGVLDIENDDPHLNKLRS